MSESVIADTKRWAESRHEREDVKQCCKHVLAIQPGDLIGLRAVLAELNALDEHFSACQSHVLADAALLRFIDDIGVADLHEQLAPYFE